MRTRSIAVAMAAGLLAASIIAGPAHGATTLTVRAGMGFGKTIPAGTARIMAPDQDGNPTVNVHTDDVIHFAGAAPALLPQGQEPMSWWDQYGGGSGRPFSFFVSDPDADSQGVDAPNKVNPTVENGNANGCGDSEANACSYDGSDADPVTGVLNPGDTQQFYVKITASPNTTLWALNPPPTAHTILRINVVPNGQAATTQAELDSAKTSGLAKDLRTYHRVVKKLSKPTFTSSGGHRVYDAYAGYDTETVSILRMLPQKLHIKKGDSIEWHFHILRELHTVTFPFKKGEAISNSGFVPECDPDGDSGQGPDTPADFSATPPCPQGSGLELDPTRSLTEKTGDGTFPGGSNTLESSGLHGALVPHLDGMEGGTDPFTLRFPKASGKNGFRYL
ncbi:MAG: hypothetical protein QOF16_1484, partial [Actinomycetota bacterium]|nr:hypothetical protein [Actinomycetota bacterium]